MLINHILVLAENVFWESQRIQYSLCVHFHDFKPIRWEKVQVNTTDLMK